MIGLPRSRRVGMLAAAFLFAFIASSADAVVHVRSDASSGGDGSSWTTAFTQIQAGLNAATVANNEVWVAAGTYTENISLRPDVLLYGGFAGTETQRSDRNPETNPTIIDGGEAGNTVIGADGALIDGFTITNGKTVGSGGGVYCSYTSPTISNCKITANFGAGVYCYQSSPTIIGCEITATDGTGIVCNPGGNPQVIGCTIAGNISQHYAGVYCNSASLTIRECKILDNEASSSGGIGGGISFISATPSVTVENCVIAGNSADYGGGVYCLLSSPSLINCTIAANAATSAGGNLYATSSSDPTVMNTILSFGDAPVGACAYKDAFSDPTFSYSDFWSNGSSAFEPATWDPTIGSSNITLDPAFADGLGGDYHLMSSSACIDTGTNAGAPSGGLDGNLRPYGAYCDIGAYEYAPPPTSVTVGGAKALSDGSRISLSGAVVTAVFTEYFYVEQDDCSAGIRVAWTGGVTEERRVNVTGTLETRDGIERQVRADGVSDAGPGSVEPIGMKNRALGGSDYVYAPGPPVSGQMGRTGGAGLNNVGLLVRTWGRVIPVDSTSFRVDDGSGIQPRVVLPAGVAPPGAGRAVGVTGVSSLESGPGSVTSLIVMRREADMVVLD